MGKTRLEAIRLKYGLNETNLNPYSEDTLILQKVNRAAARKTHQHTLMMRKVRRLTKQIKKIQTRDYVKARTQLFGFWYYWFTSGKIGPDEDVEPNLLANVLSNKNMETLLQRYGLRG